MYAIKHISGIIEFSTANEHAEKGAICVEVPGDMGAQSNHFYDIVDGKLIDIAMTPLVEPKNSNEDFSASMQDIINSI